MDIKIEFEHEQFKPPMKTVCVVHDSVLTTSWIKGSTRCKVIICRGIIDAPYYARGVAFCNVPDNFSRVVGRKKALTSAIRHLPRDIRTKIWNKYWKHHKKG